MALEVQSDYLNPPPLTTAQVEIIYGRDDADDIAERRFGRAAFAALRAIIQSHGWNTL